MTTIEKLKRIAEIDFSEIVKSSFILNFKLRIILFDNSYVDVNISSKIPDKFGFHWETRNKENHIYRYDNFPDINWKDVNTFPYHFHEQSQENVVNSPFPTEIIPAFYSFMNFIKERINL